MKVPTAMLLICLFASGCDTNEDPPRFRWTKLGLDGKSVTEMQLAKGKLYVATTSGLFVRNVSTVGTFTSLGFAGKNVEAIEVIDDDRIIASVYDKSAVTPPALFSSDDGGQTWEVLDSNFGGETAEPVFDLVAHPDNPETFYASGFASVAKSSDGGRTWQTIFGNWSGLATGVSVVTLNPYDPAEVWAGGQGAIENGYLIRTKDEHDWQTWNDLIENPSTVKEIAFGPDKDHIFTGWEGGLIRTEDGGASWETVIESEDNRFFFGIARSNGTPGRMYAGGWLKTPDPQDLVLFTSDDHGDSWTPHTVPGIRYGGIVDLLVRNVSGFDIVYVGLDKGGVYQLEVER